MMPTKVGFAGELFFYRYQQSVINSMNIFLFRFFNFMGYTISRNQYKLSFSEKGRNSPITYSILFYV